MSKDDDIKATIARLRAQNSATAPTTRNDKPRIMKEIAASARARISESVEKLDAVTRNSMMNAVSQQLLTGELTQGEALKLLRMNVLGMKQDAYARLVKVSRKTISDIENNKINNSIETVNKVFKPFGLQMGLLPISRTRLHTLLTTESDKQ